MATKPPARGRGASLTSGEFDVVSEGGLMPVDLKPLRSHNPILKSKPGEQGLVSPLSAPYFYYSLF
ncbi:hypothetical protein [[Phormidium] sp. ETS-05]|uniref:hypothetical protein n=1 Tax=[Phormidium] sp. ETS-05 TaxID=222819 RepID=UPI0018EEDFA1|nr:hypothetical protein [[Phormidium] sp. ETS-05]